jgi:hypothetical protein
MEGDLQLAALHPFFANGQNSTCLHLQVQGSEPPLAYMLGLAAALKEQWFGLCLGLDEDEEPEGTVWKVHRSMVNTDEPRKELICIRIPCPHRTVPLSAVPDHKISFLHPLGSWDTFGLYTTLK